MQTQVSRESTVMIEVGGRKLPACPSCWIRPKRWSGNRWQPCAPCHARDMRDRRAGKVETLVTPSELELLHALRAGSISWPELTSSA